MELLDGALKLRHCTDLFTMRFPPWSLPRVGNGGGKGSGLPRRHVQVNTFYGILDQGHSTPRRWKRLRSPSSEGVGGEVDEPHNLFPRLGVG